MVVRLIRLLGLLALLLSACRGPAAAARGSTVDQDHVQQCSNLCYSAGARLTSIVIVGNQTGCVCEFASPDAANVAASASVIGGGVALMMQSAQRERDSQGDPNDPNAVGTSVPGTVAAPIGARP